jgi:hypothetical protein
MGDREKKAGIATGSSLVAQPAPVLAAPPADPELSGIGGLLGDLLGGPHEPWIDILTDVLVTGLPMVLGVLDGQTTALEIAAPAVKALLQLGENVIEDLLAQKSVSDTRKTFDDALADLLSELKFGPKSEPLPPEPPEL